ncbi:prepilin-type N-terminal cleavage/methylation domain-containing protein, partial [bacterium]|nr:prepilin-type N-terminal cleavage/methylation domain-containing protein [bacterium]
MKVPPNHCIRPSESRDGILWPVRRSRPRGITLIELMIAVGIVTAVVGVMGFLSLGTWRTFLISRSYMDVEGLARLAMDWMARDIRGAVQIYTSKDIDGDTYTTGSSQLVLEKISDVVVYFLTEKGSDVVVYSLTGSDPYDLKRRKNTSPDVIKLIATDIYSLNFDTSSTTLVELSLKVSKT